MCGKTCRMATSLDDIKSPLFWRAVIAEFIGTCFLVLIGCGSCIGWEDDYNPTMVQIALAFGLSVATMVWCIGSVSGGHINPAVTCSMLVTRKISLVRAILYIISQCLGAAAGAAVLKGVTPIDVQGALGTTTPHPDVKPGMAFGVEFMITFVLVFTVFASCDSKRDDLNGSAPLSIGLSVAVCHLFAIKYTGSSMNSARSIGPAIVQNIWTDHWVYWTGPILGGIVAGLLYENLFSSNASISKARAYLLSAAYNSDEYEANRESKIPLQDVDMKDDDSV